MKSPINELKSRRSDVMIFLNDTRKTKRIDQ